MKRENTNSQWPIKEKSKLFLICKLYHQRCISNAVQNITTHDILQSINTQNSNYILVTTFMFRGHHLSKPPPTRLSYITECSSEGKSNPKLLFNVPPTTTWNTQQGKIFLPFPGYGPGTHGRQDSGLGAIQPSYPQAAFARWQTSHPRSPLWTASGSEWS